MFEKFFFPEFNKKFILRIVLLVAILWMLFSFVLMPCFINGKSMQPTYGAFGFNFCNKLKYLKNPVKYGDIVILKYIGRKYYLKRVIGVAGDSIEFRYGVLYRNGEKIKEPYVKLPSRWNMEKITVKPGMIFVVGDNRSMPKYMHEFGSVKIQRITGAPLW